MSACGRGEAARLVATSSARAGKARGGQRPRARARTRPGSQQAGRAHLEPCAMRRRRSPLRSSRRRCRPGPCSCASASPSAQLIGCVHCVLRFGPSGPLKNAGCSSPHRPSNAIHGKSDCAAIGPLGIVRTTGRTSIVGPRVSSQPTPSSAELPRYRASSKKFACEPSAGCTTGCVPSISSSLSSPQLARSAPSCWL